jgi:hypothetical protein
MKPGWYVSYCKDTKQSPIVYLGISKLDMEPRAPLSERVDVGTADVVFWHPIGYIVIEDFLSKFTLTHRIKNGKEPRLEPV